MRKSVIVLMSVLLLVTACGRKKACNEPVNKDFGVQLYSIRSVIGDSALYAANHEEAFKALAEMGYSYVEAACYNDGKLYGVEPTQFKADLEALEWADTCVLVLPSGRSAHTEAGWMAGAGRRVFVYIPEMQEPELMYKLFDGVFGSLDELLDALKR